MNIYLNTFLVFNILNILYIPYVPNCFDLYLDSQLHVGQWPIPTQPLKQVKRSDNNIQS